MRNLWQKLNKGLLLCYAAYLVLWLAQGLLWFGFDRLFTTPALLAPSMAQTQELQPVPGGLQSTGYDPQLIFTGGLGRVRRVVLVGSFDTVPGEVDLYYTRAAGDGFSPQKRVWGRLQSNGYAFNLPPGGVAALRIDPGNLPGVTLTLEGVWLNPRQPFWQYFAFSLRGVLAFLVLPALAYCVIYTIILVWHKKNKPQPAKT